MLIESSFTAWNLIVLRIINKNDNKYINNEHFNTLFTTLHTLFPSPTLASASFCSRPHLSGHGGCSGVGTSEVLEEKKELSNCCSIIPLEL